MTTLESAVAVAVSAFGAAVTPKLAAGAVVGEPEDQLRGPLEVLLGAAGAALGRRIVPKGEASLAAYRSRPDYGVEVDGALAGYLEVKAPGKGADPAAFADRHDREQWERLQSLPNIVYTDGNAWGLYRDGERVGDLVTLTGDVRSSGARLAPAGPGLAGLLTAFLSWRPTAPRGAAELARTTARLCRLLRAEVVEVLAEEAKRPGGATRPFSDLAADWRHLLFPDASDERFADSYAQTVAFALLLARSEGIATADVGAAARALGRRHGLLGRALAVLTDEAARSQVVTSLAVISRVLDAVDWSLVDPPSAPTLPGFLESAGRTDNPWLYFYEEFLEAYDPELRKDAGAYYTPAEVVAAQVRLVEDLLVTRLGKKLGFADDGVVTLDPAMGTGSYLLRVVDQAAERVVRREGSGAKAGRMAALASRLVGFENMTGPYAVAELQLTEALRHRDADVPPGGLRLHLTDTLADPYVEETRLGGLYEPIAQSRRAANRVKREERVLVCLGNPPYDRHGADPGAGGWVVHGSPGVDRRAVWTDFLPPAGSPTARHAKNLYNLYAYFWRWALWKVLEAHPEEPSGVVAFVTAASFATGPGFAAMRAHLRRTCDEVWVIDLSPEGFRPPVPTRVFPGVQVPLAVTICLRTAEPDPAVPAAVRRAAVAGSRADKLAALSKLGRLSDLGWRDCETGWEAPFVPAGADAWAATPALTDLLPWQENGVQAKRTWPTAPAASTLDERWARLAAVTGAERSALFRGSGDRTVASAVPPLPGFDAPEPATLAGPDLGPRPPAVRYGYRSFDRQWLLADARLISRPRPDLWTARGDAQVFLTTSTSVPLSDGPAVTATAFVPDLHHFSGRGGKDVFPLWRDAGASEPNVAPGLLGFLADLHDRDVAGPDLFAYVAGVLAHSGYAARYRTDLATPGPRVPLTADPDLFSEAVGVGREVLWLHTYGERFADPAAGRPPGDVPPGRARVLAAVPPTPMPERPRYDPGARVVRVGEGTVGPVAPEVGRYEVSGMRVVDHWLAYRRRVPAGKKSSPLDGVVAESWPAAWTTELLELLWVLERLVALEPRQADLLGRIAAGPLVTVADLTAAGVLPVPEEARKARRRPKGAKAAALPDLGE